MTDPRVKNLDVNAVAANFTKWHFLFVKLRSWAVNKQGGGVGQFFLLER